MAVTRISSPPAPGPIRKMLRWVGCAATFFLAASGFAAPLDIALQDGDHLRVVAVAPGIFHVQLSPDGKFSESLMERYGVVRTDWPPVAVKIETQTAMTRIVTADASLTVNSQAGQLELFDNRGNPLCSDIQLQPAIVQGAALPAFLQRQKNLQEYFQGEQRQLTAPQPIVGATTGDPSAPGELHEFNLPQGSFGATFNLQAGERFYGLGEASAYRLQLRGYAYRLWAQYRGAFGYHARPGQWEQTEGPIPFLYSTAGWGVFVNTTWIHYYDIGRDQKDKMFFWGPGGSLDFYLLAALTPARLIGLYDDITGKPRLMPLFGYGLTYVAPMSENEHEILEDSLHFRKHGIPCDLIGLEPQWMKKHYDLSHDQEWNPDKFYMPAWKGPASEGSFIDALKNNGFKTSLWNACDDDFTIEAERQVVIREGGGKSFTNEPDAWFDHLKKFASQGVRAFKIDPYREMNEHLDRHYFNQRTDLENHNLTQTLIHQQMCAGYERVFNERAMVHYCSAYAGVQKWGSTTMGDNGGGPKALIWMLNYAMSGNMNTSCDMDTSSKAGLHFGFLQPWSQHNSWGTVSQPWFLGKELEACYRDYARLRYSLMPYIYSAAHAGNRTGMPMLRPMPLVYPEDSRLSNCTNEYMFGDSLLVTAFSSHVTFPAGRWIDYWTGTEYTGPRQMEYSCPPNRGGGLFIKAGAIIPCWPEMNYVGEKPVETLILQVYPEGDSEFNLFEDDGNSLAYQTGQVATTRIKCHRQAGQITLTIDPRQGTFQGMTASRTYDVLIHSPTPKMVRVDGLSVPEAELYSAEQKAVHLHASEPKSRNHAIVIECQTRDSGD